jgi:hypothetical protein
MSVNQPPNPNVDTFNNLYWLSGDTALTTAEADLRYLKFPVAQGTENLQTTNVNGVLTCNNNVIVNNKSLEIDGVLGEIKYADNTVQNTAYTGATPGTYTATNMTIDANGKISAISNGAASTQKTYTLQYTTNTTVTLPTDCIGIGVRCIGKGGGGGQAANTTAPATTWNAGGSGGGGGFITSTSIINLVAGQQITINVTVSLSEVNVVGFGQLCRANAGSNGGNATASSGGGAGGGGAFTSNSSYGSFYSLVGSTGVAGGTNLPFQTASYPASAGSVVLQPWNPATVYGAGSNWNGSVTSNSFQGPAITNLTGIVYITYYLK